MRKQIIIVGGGFFGMYLAEQFSLLGHKVKLFEKEKIICLVLPIITRHVFIMDIIIREAF
ncbi:TPA: NAD(P)-binding protein [Escherichia coli]